MPFPRRLLLFFFSICIAVPAAAKIAADTTAKRMNVPLTHSNFQSIDKIGGIRDGILAIRADSVQKGIHLLNIGIKQAFTALKLNRLMNYNEMEFVTLLENLDTDSLSAPEKTLGLALIKMVFQRGTAPNGKNLDSYFKAAPNTPFVQRMRLMIHTNTGDKELAGMLKSLLKKQPESIALNMLQAEQYFQQEKYDAAIPWCDKAIRLWPAYAYAYNVRARCEGQLKKYDLEVKDEDQALANFPNYPEAYYYRAAAYEDLQKYHEAASNYLEVDARLPGYEYTNYSLARCYKLLEMPDSALFYIKRYILQYADDADGYDMKGDIYYNKDDYAASVECYSQAISLKPASAGNYQDRGNAYFYWGKPDTAIADFTKAATLDKKDPYPVERIGDCYYRMKDYEKSLTYHRKALAIDPKYKDAWVSLENCYNRMGQHQLGVEACKKALAIDSTFDLAIGNLGWEYYCTGHFDECITWSYKCLRYNEKATYAMFNIALATLRKGEFEKAKGLYTHFLSLCKEKNYELEGGAEEDLRDLIKKDILREEATHILKDIFNEEP